MTEKRRKTDGINLKFFTQLGAICASMGAIGIVLLWFGKTTFATNDQMGVINDKINKIELIYVSDLSKIKNTQAIQGEKIKNIETNIHDIKNANIEILKILRN